MKSLWIVGGGFETVPGIKRAVEMGYHVIVSDGDEHAPGFKVAHDAVLASTYDVNATLSAATAYSRSVHAIDGVISIATDVPLTVASVAEALGLPGISVATAKLASDKFAMKTRLKEKGIPVPWFARVRGASELRAAWRRRGKTLVLKPVDSRGARGVLRIDERVDFGWAYAHALAFSPSGRVMVEDFIAGPQVSTEGLVLKNSLCPVACNDRNYEYLDRFHPFMIENGGSFPSRLAADERDALSLLALEAGRALGVTSGVVKGDMVLGPDGPLVIEIAPRLSGGLFCTHQIPLGTGVDMVGAAIRLALGQEVNPESLVPRTLQGVAIRYFFPEAGALASHDDPALFREEPWIEELRLQATIGAPVGEPRNHTERAGFVLTTGATAAIAVTRAEHVVKCFEIETTPDIKTRKAV